MRIDGPQVQWDSHPQRRARRWQPAATTAHGRRLVAADAQHAPTATASPSAWATRGWAQRPRTIGWVTLAALLLLTALAYAYVRHLLRPLDDIGAGALRFGQRRLRARRSRVRRHDELGDLAEQVNPWRASLHGMLDAKRALLLAISHELRTPLTRARLNAELVDDRANARATRCCATWARCAT